MVICLNYGHFEKLLRSVIVSQNHYLNQILDVHPLTKVRRNLKLFLKQAYILTKSFEKKKNIYFKFNVKVKF